MKMKNFNLFCISALLSLLVFSGEVIAQTASVSVNADIVSRYVWRGFNINEMPNIQPALTIKYGGLQGGFWGSYGFTHLLSTEEHYGVNQEVDTWLSYSTSLSKSISATAIVTDYYYPNAGIKIGNFNNYNNAAGAGAHTIEVGLTLAGPETFPLSICGYMNVYNDKGKNVYFEACYSTTLKGTGLMFFVGAAMGSVDNPSYYNTDKLNVVNIGLKASKQIKITESYSLPVFCSYVLNPRNEMSYLVFGVTL